MSTVPQHYHITRNPQILGGEPIINGTRIPVRAIVETWRLGVPPEEITTHFPHITLAQVFDALGYFADHQQEITQYIEQNRIPEDRIHPRTKP